MPTSRARQRHSSVFATPGTPSRSARDHPRQAGDDEPADRGNLATRLISAFRAKGAPPGCFSVSLVRARPTRRWAQRTRRWRPSGDPHLGCEMVRPWERSCSAARRDGRAGACLKRGADRASHGEGERRGRWRVMSAFFGVRATPQGGRSSVRRASPQLFHRVSGRRCAQHSGRPRCARPRNCAAPGRL